MKNNIHEKKRILILGASGMLGHTIFKYFSIKDAFVTLGTYRKSQQVKLFPEVLKKRLQLIPDISDEIFLKEAINDFHPDIVINCVGIVKQLSTIYTPVDFININSLFPHKLSLLCQATNTKLIHFSTDCVFSGDKGMYKESDVPDARDIYGRSKLLGEVSNEDAITIRTSIIGHELLTSHSLINWFLNEKKSIKGYKKAIFSGLPTTEIAQILETYIIYNSSLKGLYHLSSDPINKFDLLSLVAKTYKKEITIEPDSSVKINRSLDSSVFRKQTGFKPKSWVDLIQEMYDWKK
tara:strand:- start:16078 stop:16959 length:882 start_codon:yes stop_codon:yes gene_type:complete